MEREHAAEPFFFGELEGEEKKAFEAHLKECKECREKLKFLRTVHREIVDSSLARAEEKGAGERCLTPEILSRLVAGVLEEAEKEEVLNHLCCCPSCRNELMECLELEGSPLVSLPQELREMALPGEVSGKKEERKEIAEPRAMPWWEYAYSRILPFCAAAAILFILAINLYQHFSLPPCEMLVNEPSDLRSPASTGEWREGSFTAELGEEDSRVLAVLNRVKSSLGSSSKKEGVGEILKSRLFLLDLLNALRMEKLLGRGVEGEDLAQRMFVKIDTHPFPVHEFFGKKEFKDFNCLVTLRRRDGGEGARDKWLVSLKFQKKAQYPNRNLPGFIFPLPHG